MSCSQHAAGTVLCTECGSDAMALPPALRIQATVVRRHATQLASLVRTLDEFEALPAFILTLEQKPAVRSALIFALAVLSEWDVVQHDGGKP